MICCSYQREILYHWEVLFLFFRAIKYKHCPLNKETEFGLFSQFASIIGISLQEKQMDIGKRTGSTNCLCGQTKVCAQPYFSGPQFSLQKGRIQLNDRESLISFSFESVTLMISCFYFRKVFLLQLQVMLKGFGNVSHLLFSLIGNSLCL